ncbi:DoxX family membrane protein [soil metagenome]
MNRNVFFNGAFFVTKIAVGSIFIFTGVSKLLDLQAFSDNIVTFDLAPYIFTNLIALTLPVLEVIFGGMLLFGKQDRVAALGIACLAALFFVAFSQAALRGLNVDCGCFGAGNTHSDVWLGLFRALVILLVAAGLYSKGYRQARQ